MLVDATPRSTTPRAAGSRVLVLCALGFLVTGCGDNTPESPPPAPAPAVAPEPLPTAEELQLNLDPAADALERTVDELKEDQEGDLNQALQVARPDIPPIEPIAPPANP